MAAKVDLRKVKDQATKAVEKKQYAKAAELYLQISLAEPTDPDWHQRAGESFRKVPDIAQAVRELELAAEGYAKGGFLLKAIAVCKVVLQIDPKHTATQATLAELYAKREGRPAPGKVPLAAPVEVGRTSSGTFTIAPKAAPPVAAPAPLDALPLAQIFGAHRSQQFSVAALAAAAEVELEPSAYEISLDEEVDVSLADAIPVERPTAPPSLPKIPLLSSLDADDLRYVIERVDVRDLEPRDVVLRQGEQGGSLFVVVSGRVQVVTESPRRELASLGEGAFFGELALLTNFPRSATVVAAAPTQLLEISRELVSEIVRRSPEVLKTLLRFFRDRLLDRMFGASPLFSSFSPEEARALSDRFLFLELEPRMRAIVEGERAPGMFLLLCGEARVTRGSSEVARLQPGDVFGEMSLLHRGAATATIETLSKCWALELPRERFQEVMLTYPQMLEYISNIADQRQQQNLAGAESRVDFL
ncbi:MAG: putative transcriptional regulator, Crp/Fnr family [bacterium]|nr:putative transcriptional regulator, Crp/Fnr family [bacterium]